MRITSSQAAARPAYFDRNSVPTAFGHATVGAAPHAETIRASYTVPAGKKAWVGTVWLYEERSTAAAPAAKMWSALKYTPFGGTIRYIDESILATNGVNDIVDRTVTGFEFMASGDKLDLVSADQSTGGTSSPFGTVKYTEFDA